MLTLPSMPPAVTTSSPLATASIIALCSFCRFICGRIMMKYSTTNISTSGRKLSRLLSGPAAGAVVWGAPGVAQALMAEAERQVRANGHGKAWLAVVAGNARARAFYEHSGWSDEGPFDYAAASEGGTIVVPCHRYTKAV